MQTNVKMPTIVGILTFMSMINFMLSLVEHNVFYNLETRFYHMLVFVFGLRLYISTTPPILLALLCDIFNHFEHVLTLMMVHLLGLTLICHVVSH